MAKNKATRVARLTNAPSRKRQARPTVATLARQPARVPFRVRLLRWLSRSNLVLVLGVIVAATILTIMYFRITEPVATATPAVAATSSALP